MILRVLRRRGIIYHRVSHAEHTIVDSMWAVKKNLYLDACQSPGRVYCMLWIDIDLSARH